MPGYFAILTIVALQVFVHEQVDVAILEVGIGGEYDCTNIFSRANVVGITSLGYDHTVILGNTLSEIAWQKSGIFKPGTIAITSYQQPTETIQVLNERALEKKCLLLEAPPLQLYNWIECKDSMGIRGPAQHLNLSLALQLVNAFINPWQYNQYADKYKHKNTTMIQAPLFELCAVTRKAIGQCTWQGRAQVLKDENHNTCYYLDGAHNLESIDQCVKWFQQLCPINDDKQRVLIFTMTGNRDFKNCLNLLAKCNFNYVCFTPKFPHVTSSLLNDDLHPDLLLNSQDADKSITMTNDCYQWWMSNTVYYDNQKCIRTECVKQAIQWINGISGLTSSHVLVTGSLHLVGSFLYLLQLSDR